MKSKTIVSHIVAVVVGGFFVVSGIGKLLNVEQLITTVQNYGVPSFLAPAAIFLPPLEIIIGILVVFPATRKPSSGIILMLLIIFTGAFLYAHFFRNVQNCGCSGEFSFFDKNLSQLLLTNFVFLVLSAFLFEVSKSASGALYAWQKVIISLTTILSSTAAGASSIEPLYQLKPNWVGMNVHSTPLASFIAPHTDSTYVLFFYSLNCPRCWSAIENVKALQSARVVDKVVGYTFGADSSLVKFERSFHSNFSTNLIPIEELKVITHSVPMLFFIKNDTVIYSGAGQVMAPLWYEQYVLREVNAAPF